MPKITVIVSGVSPHSAIYTPYKGVGALDPAENETLSEAIRRNAAEADKVVGGP